MNNQNMGLLLKDVGANGENVMSLFCNKKIYL